VDKSYPEITMLSRASDIIDFIAQDYVGKSAIDLMREFHFPKTTCYRLLYSLVQCELLIQDKESGLYYLGKKFSDYATIAEHRFCLLREVARPHLERLSLEVQETVKISVLSNMSSYVLDRAEGAQDIKISVKTGSVFPLHAGASSKLLFLSLGARTQTALFERGLSSYTSKTITTQKNMLLEFNRILKQGYSVDNGEYIEGIGAVACPLYDYSGKIIAAVSVTYATSSTSQATIDSIIPRLKEATQTIGQAFKQQHRLP